MFTGVLKPLKIAYSDLNKAERFMDIIHHLQKDRCIVVQGLPQLAALR